MATKTPRVRPSWKPHYPPRESGDSGGRLFAGVLFFFILLLFLALALSPTPMPW